MQVGQMKVHEHTIDFLEHLPYILNVVVIQEPGFAVLLLLFEGYGEGICHIYGLPIVLA